MSDVVKAGVLEVTVVQAVGVNLLGPTPALTRTRRKPSLVARVTVDGTTKSGQPAQRSHHPVWFPAQPRSPSANDNTASSSSNSHARGGVARSSSSSSGSGSGSGSRNNSNSNNINNGGRRGGNSARVYSRTNTGAPQERQSIAGSLDRTRAGYGSGREGGSSSSAGRSGGGGGGGGGGVRRVGPGDGGRSGNESGSSSNNNSSSSSIARGLLFEVREFYGPTRIVVELVSSGGGGGSGGTGGGAVLGACEARLAEALVRRGGGGSGSSSKLEKSAVFGLGKVANQIAGNDEATAVARAAQGPPPSSTVFSAEEVEEEEEEEARRSPLSLAERNENKSTDSGGGGDGDSDGDSDGGGGSGDANADTVHPPAPDAHVGNNHQDRVHRPDLPAARDGDASGASADTAAAAAPISTAAATTTATTADANANATSAQCSAGCLPGGGVFGRWRRRRRRGGHQSSSERCDSRSSSRANKPKFFSGRGSGVPSSIPAAKDAAESTTKPATNTSGGSSSSSSSSRAFTLDEAEMLATSIWSGGGGANGTARDIWKELVHVGGGGGGGKGGKGKLKAGAGGGAGRGNGAGAVRPAVRLRLRFVPLWDCLADGGGANGLGALHAAARDGDARLTADGRFCSLEERSTKDILERWNQRKREGDYPGPPVAEPEPGLASVVPSLPPRADPHPALHRSRERERAQGPVARDRERFPARRRERGSGHAVAHGSQSWRGRHAEDAARANTKDRNACQGFERHKVWPGNSVKHDGRLARQRRSDSVGAGGDRRQRIDGEVPVGGGGRRCFERRERNDPHRTRRARWKSSRREGSAESQSRRRYCKCAGTPKPVGQDGMRPLQDQRGWHGAGCACGR